MNIPIEQFIPSGAGLIGTAVGLVTMWNKFQNKVERLEELRSEDRRQIDAFWKWKDEHERDVVDQREKFNRELSRLEGQSLVVNEQYRQVVSLLTDIKNGQDEMNRRISDLERK